MELIFDRSTTHPRGWIDFFYTDTLNAEIHRCPNNEIMIFVNDKSIGDGCRLIDDWVENLVIGCIASVVYLAGADPITYGFCWLDSTGTPTGCNGVVVTDDGPAGFKDRTELLHLAGRDKVAATLLETFEALIEKANELLKERN